MHLWCRTRTAQQQNEHDAIEEQTSGKKDEKRKGKENEKEKKRKRKRKRKRKKQTSKQREQVGNDLPFDVFFMIIHVVFIQVQLVSTAKQDKFIHVIEPSLVDFFRKRQVVLQNITKKSKQTSDVERVSRWQQ